MSLALTAQLDFEREVKDRGCLRTDDCYAAGIELDDFDEPGSPTYNPDAPKVEKCLHCERYRGVVTPPHIAALMAEALRLERLEKYGYAQTITLTPIDWVCLDALELARRDEQRKDEKAREAGSPQWNESKKAAIAQELEYKKTRRR